MSRIRQGDGNSRGEKPLPEALRGFETVNRFWDRQLDYAAAKIMPGEYYVTPHDEMITTVLGSCVSACVRDRKLGVGGMNHFMLPVRSEDDADGARYGLAERYGNFAMEHLINTILKNGGRREYFEVKVFGGGKILSQMTDIGRRNIEFVMQYLETEGLYVAAADVGDVYPRKVVYYPANGKALVKKLKSLHDTTLIEREETYRRDLERRPMEGDIELFD